MTLTYLVTGSAGFIGSALVMRLLERGDVVVGIDNHNAYYDKGLKEARLASMLITKTINTFELTSQIKVKLKKFFLNTSPRGWFIWPLRLEYGILLKTRWLILKAIL